MSRPFVSVLVAARNEELLLPRCLQALAGQSYPHFEVLIGEDRSDDQTATIAAEFARTYPHFSLIPIRRTLPGLYAKANVLAQLCQQARGEFFLITDADTQVPADWISTLVHRLPAAVGMRTGFTLPQGDHLRAHLQTLDWLAALSINHWFADRNVPLAAMGNNMLVRRQAYEEVGGYTEVPFSVTEDFALFRALREQGWKYESCNAPDALARTRAEARFSDLIRQRKRWIRGALEVGGGGTYAGIFVCLQLLFFGLLFSWFPALGMAFTAVVWGGSLLLLRRAQRHFGLRIPEFALFLYPFYAVFTYFLFFVLYLTNQSVRWRGRTY